MKIDHVVDNISMKRSLFISNVVFLMIMGLVVEAFSGNTWYEEAVVIYSKPDPLKYGLAPIDSEQRLRDMYDFGLGGSQQVLHYEESGFLTATLMSDATAKMLDTIFQEVPTAKASSGSLKWDGYYSAITLGEHELYRVTHSYHYNEFHHQVTSRLERPHYLYYNNASGVLIEFSLEHAPLDMLLLLKQEMTDSLALVESEEVILQLDAIKKLEELRSAYSVYTTSYVLRIHRTNSFQNQGYSEMEDVMFAATLLGSTHQYWQGIPAGNDYLHNVLTALEKDPRMSVYLNQGIS